MTNTETTALTMEQRKAFSLIAGLLEEVNTALNNSALLNLPEGETSTIVEDLKELIDSAIDKSDNAATLNLNEGEVAQVEAFETRETAMFEAGQKVAVLTLYNLLG